MVCAEKGILSLWSQMFAEFLAITWMLDHEAGIKKSLPVFGGDFNNHMIMHQPSSHVLHFMKHDPDNAGKRCAVACMRHLLTQDNVLPLESGKSLYFSHCRSFSSHFWGLSLAALHFTSLQIVIWQIVATCVFANIVMPSLSVNEARGR